jgi:hypothetical protein
MIGLTALISHDFAPDQNRHVTSMARARVHGKRIEFQDSSYFAASCDDQAVCQALQKLMNDAGINSRPPQLTETNSQVR